MADSWTLVGLSWLSTYFLHSTALPEHPSETRTMSPSPRLGELQLAIMRILWQKSEATVAEVHAFLKEERGLAPTTVARLSTTVIVLPR